MNQQEKIYSEIRKNFYYKYGKYVVPTLEKYESDRVQTLILAILSTITLLMFGTIISVIMATKSQLGISFGLTLIVSGLNAGWLIKKNFERKIKKKIMPMVCSCFPKLKWIEPAKLNSLWDKISYVNGISIENLSDDSDEKKYVLSNLMKNYSSIYIDDRFEGEYNNVKFFINENRTERGSGKSRAIIFSGVIIIVEMNKNFKGNTVIQPDAVFHKSPDNLHRTVLEDVEFEKKFDVFTDDDVEARYLITPTLMERLKSMQLAFKAKEISASFYQNKFYIALHTNKDLFSLGSLTKNISDREQFITMFDEILSIIKLIDHFKLDQKIGI